MGVGRWCGRGVLCEEGQSSGRQAAQSRNALKGEPGLSGFLSVCLGSPELGRWKRGRGWRLGSEGRVPKESLGGSRNVGIRERGRGWGLQEDVIICGKDGELGRLWCGH